MCIRDRDLRSASCPASCGPSITVVGDPPDDLVLACAIAIGADYIVSNDMSFLRVKEYQGIRILSPNEFLDLKGKSSEFGL